jgi:hypothetical protein
MMLLEVSEACECPDPVRLVVEARDGRTFVHDVSLDEPDPMAAGLRLIRGDGLRVPDDVATVQCSCSSCGRVLTVGRNL